LEQIISSTRYHAKEPALDPDIAVLMHGQSGTVQNMLQDERHLPQGKRETTLPWEDSEHTLH
jgi:hypothetical protein